MCNQLVNWGYSPRGPGASAGSRGRAMIAGSSARRAMARLARARFPPGRARVPAPAFASSSSNQPHWEGGGGGGAPNQGRRDRGANVPPAASDPRASSFAARAWISSEADAVANAAAPTERKKSPKSRKNGGGTSANGRTARTENGGPVVELWGDDADGGVDVPPPPPQRQAQQQQQMRGETLSGEIRRVTFHNPDNQWTVARLLVSNSHTDALPIGATAANNNMPKYKQRKSKKGAKADKVVTVVGHIPGVAEGQFLEMRGEWREVDKWGMQFQLSATPVEVTPQDEDAILRYLAGGALPGVGKVTAGKLVSHFGAKTFEVFDSPDAVALLVTCPGIGKKTAEKLKGNWDETRGRRDAIVFLERHGVAPALAQRVAAQHGTKTEERVRADPFGSMTGVRGATFHRCDALAARLGKKPDDPARLAAAMLQVLQSTAVSEGHVYVPWAHIKEGVGRVLGSQQFASLREGALEEAADVLRARGDVARFELTPPPPGGRDSAGGSVWERSGVFASVLHDAEAFVAADIAARLRRERREPDVPRVRRWLQAAAAKEGWRLLSPAQEAFLDLALREPISVLTGGPGTGKTFATHIAVRLWRAMGRKVLMCAPTGRAAQRLAEIATAGRRMSQPVQSSTIHRLLETRKGRNKSGGDEDDDAADDQTSSLSYKGAFARNRSSPLDADVVVVDESSMLDLPLCAALLDAIKPDAQIVFVGDADQLPSVGPGSVLGDVLASGAVPAVQLRDVFRQAEQSGIVRSAHAINGGHLPVVPTRRFDPAVGDIVETNEHDPIDSKLRGTPLAMPFGGHGEVTYETQTWDGADCVWVTLPDDSPAGYEGALEALFRGALPALRGLDPTADLQVLTPFRRGPASTQQLNAYLQARLNPPGSGRLETRVGDVTIREGDRVLQQRNDYTKEVFNGDLGTVVAVDGDGGVRVVFGGAAANSKQASDAPEDEHGSNDDASSSPNEDTVDRALASLKHGGREVSYSRTDLRDLIPAWALTVHKAQGSEYRAVVLTLANAHRPLLRRELVYTAVSRAKEVLVVLAPRQALETAVNSVGTNRRNTTLARRLAPLAPSAPSCPATAAIAAAADEAERRNAGGGVEEEA